MIDVGNAYLNAMAKKRMYMRLPRDWTMGREIVVRLVHSIYGLKDAGLLWYLMLEDILVKFGYVRSKYDTCIFLKNTGDTNRPTSIIALYVDDLSILASSKKELDDFKNHMKSIFPKITEVPNYSKYLNIYIEDQGDFIELNLSKKFAQFAAQYKLGNKLVRMPTTSTM